MEVERFQVLASYAKSINQLAKGDIHLAHELSYWIIQYGIYGTEPPADSNPFMLSSFEQIKIPISKCRNKSGNAKKDWEIAGNQIEIKLKSNGNQTEIKTKQNIKEKIKKENKKEKKTLYGEFVELSDEEYSKLKTTFGEQRLRKIINEVNNSVGMHGYTYKNYYFVIRKRYKEEIEALEKKETKSQLPDYDHLDPILS